MRAVWEPVRVLRVRGEIPTHFQRLLLRHRLQRRCPVHLYHLQHLSFHVLPGRRCRGPTVGLGRFERGLRRQPAPDGQVCWYVVFVPAMPTAGARAAASAVFGVVAAATVALNLMTSSVDPRDRSPQPTARDTAGAEPRPRFSVSLQTGMSAHPGGCGRHAPDYRRMGARGSPTPLFLLPFPPRSRTKTTTPSPTTSCTAPTASARHALHLPSLPPLPVPPLHTPSCHDPTLLPDIRTHSLPHGHVPPAPRCAPPASTAACATSASAPSTTTASGSTRASAGTTTGSSSPSS